MALPIIRKGDVFSLPLTSGFGFIQCVKDAEKTEMEIIRVLPGIFSVIEKSIIKSVLAEKELFFTMLPLKYAVKKKSIEWINTYSVPEGSESPPYFRTKHTIGTEFLGWHIVDAETMQRRLVTHLSQCEAMLSPWGMISIPDIVERIEDNWTPSEWI